MKAKTLLLLYILAILPLISYSQEKDSKKEILFICSYSTDNDFSRSNISSFIDTYTNLKGNYQYSTEALNSTSLDDRFRWADKMRKIMQKHNQTSLVVLIGTEAIISYFSLDEPEFKKIPVFATMGQRYCAAMEGDELKALATDKNKHGIIDMLSKTKGFNLKLFYYYDYELMKDLNLIKTLFPKTKNIAVLSDNTINGVSHLRQVKLAVRKFDEKLGLIFIDGRKLSTNEAAKEFEKLPDNTAVILCGWKYDKDQVAYMDNSRYSFMKTNTDIPVFSLTGTGVGNWTIGGYIPLYRPLGEELAKKAHELLETDNWKGPYIGGYTDMLKLDMSQLKKWELLNVKLQDEVVYVNPEFSWEDYVIQYKWYFILGAGIFILITIGFIATTISNIHIRHLKRNLERKDALLEKEKSELLKYQNELIIARDKANESNRLQSAFLSNMSHEIRTPLNAIVGFSDVLISTIEPTDEQERYIGIIQHNTTLLLKLINDILDLSRIEAKKKKFFFEEADIISMLESTVASMRPNTKDNVAIIFNHKEVSMIVVTDTLRLQQIIINLIGNAIKFTNKGSITLNVERKPEEEMIEFSVTDTGCGIPDEMQDKVFERFNKVNEFVQGTGLGLAICQATVEQFGGNIWIDKNYTKGSRFVFTMPTNHKISKNEE